MRDCKHGQLARSCDICDLESSNAKLREELDKWKDCGEGGQIRVEQLAQERDLWKEKAGKLAEALADCENHSHGEWCHECLSNSCGHYLTKCELIKKALSAFRAATEGK